MRDPSSADIYQLEGLPTIRIFLMIDSAWSFDDDLSNLIRKMQMPTERMGRIVERIVRRVPSNASGRLYDPAVAIYRRKTSEMFFYAASTFLDAVPLIRSTGNLEGGITGEDILDPLRRQIATSTQTLPHF